MELYKGTKITQTIIVRMHEHEWLITYPLTVGPHRPRGAKELRLMGQSNGLPVETLLDIMLNLLWKVMCIDQKKALSHAQSAVPARCLKAADHE